MLKQKLNELYETLITQANTVEKMIEKSTKALQESNQQLIDEVIHSDEAEVNSKENAVDNLCMGILALFHPEAKDLRITMMISKMTSDLERMGDCAVNICESAEYLIQRPVFQLKTSLEMISEGTIQMVKDSIHAFIRQEVSLALRVCQYDEKIDTMRDEIYRELVHAMVKDPALIETAMHLIRVARNFEKIADLATNIAEETIYIVKGVSIKHHTASV